ncbi:MAG: T9SS type A sorting domain-containing protein [Flavobacteriales bacterium]|nr:T9SS type A sorting domain-containing protein [Flavobacteriales bacterium]
MNEIVPDRLPIHPNPSTGSFFIPAQTVAGSVEVFDQAGRSVHGAWFPAGSTSLHLDLPDGAYVVQLTSSDGRGSRSRLMILHP